jgi:hypothetical protein
MIKVANTTMTPLESQKFLMGETNTHEHETAQHKIHFKVVPKVTIHEKVFP